MIRRAWRPACLAGALVAGLAACAELQEGTGHEGTGPGPAGAADMGEAGGTAATDAAPAWPERTFGDIEAGTGAVAPWAALRERAREAEEAGTDTAEAAAADGAPAGEIEAGEIEAGEIEAGEIEAGTGALAALADAEAPAGADAAAEPIDLDTARTRLRLGRELEAEGDIGAAVAAYAAALEAAWPRDTPREATPLGDVARICGRAEPAEAVARACNLAIGAFRFAPAELAGLLGNRADARSRLGRTRGALRDYRAALEIDSDNFRALIGRSRLRLAAGEPRRALNDLRLAIETGPRPAEARLLRAEAWRALGRPDRAVEDYSAVLADLEAGPLHATAWRARAETHCAMGRAEPAAVGWRLWAHSTPGGASYLQELLRARDHLRGPWETEIGPATLAALRAWTRAGCP